MILDTWLQLLRHSTKGTDQSVKEMIDNPRVIKFKCASLVRIIKRLTLGTH